MGKDATDMKVISASDSAREGIIGWFSDVLSRRNDSGTGPFR